jgi:hypothetical protein
VQRKSLRDIPSFSSSKVSSLFFLYVCFIVPFSICLSSNTFFFYLEQKFQVCGPLVSYRVEYDACDIERERERKKEREEEERAFKFIRKLAYYGP